MRRFALGLPRVRGAALAVVVSDLLDPAPWRPALVALRARGLDAAFLQVLADDEIDPPEGRFEVIDVESGERRTVDVEEVRAYRTAVQAFVRRTRAALAQAGVAHVLLAPLHDFLRTRGASVWAAAVFHGGINATAGFGIMFIRGGSDLTVGLTGVAGLAVLVVVNLVLAIATLLGGLVAYYWYPELPTAVRILIVLAGVAGGLLLLFWSAQGQVIWQFIQGSRVELRKMVWPTRQETWQTTLIVFAFVLLMGIFFWLVDMLLAWATKLLTGQGG